MTDTTTTTTTSTTYNFEEILDVAMEAALQAGEEIRKAMMITKTTTPNTSHQIITMKNNSTTDLVTETDKKCEELVMNLLKLKYPQHKIIGEETCGDNLNYELTDEPTWTIDPIDGTTNFVHQLSLTCVLISFILKKQTMVGVIYDPMADELFWAIKGKGAYMMNVRNSTSSSQPIQTSGTTSLQEAIVSMDAGYIRDEHPIVVERYISIQRALLMKRIRNIRVLGCCGLTMAYVACGRLDAGFEEGSWEYNSGPKIWDFSPGKLLVEEAGGITRDITRGGRSSRDASNDPKKEEELNLMQRSVFMAASLELATELIDIINETTN